MKNYLLLISLFIVTISFSVNGRRDCTFPLFTIESDFLVKNLISSFTQSCQVFCGRPGGREPDTEKTNTSPMMYSSALLTWPNYGCHLRWRRTSSSSILASTNLGQCKWLIPCSERSFEHLLWHQNLQDTEKIKLEPTLVLQHPQGHFPDFTCRFGLLPVSILRSPWISSITLI